MDDEFATAALAIYAGDVDQLTELLDEDPGLATRESSMGHPTLLQLIACEVEAIHDPVRVAAPLIEAGAATNYPLVSAAGCGNRVLLNFLLDEGTDIDGSDPTWTPLDEALYWSNTSIADHLVGRGARVRALSTAAGIGDFDAIAELTSEAAVSPQAGPIGSPFPNTVPPDLAHDSQSILDHALVMAVNDGQLGAAKMLVARGATVDATPPGYHWHGTALNAAVWRGDANLASWLLDLGADPTIPDGLVHSDALGWAKHHGHTHLVPLISEYHPSRPT